jgi:hypothetical protein
MWQSILRPLAHIHVPGPIVRVDLRARSPAMEQVATMDDRPCDMELDRTYVGVLFRLFYCPRTHDLPFSDVALTFYVSGRLYL